MDQEATGAKSCNRCLEYKPLSAFSKVYSNKNVYRTYCKKCAVQMVQEKRINNPNWWRKYQLKRDFGMTVDQYFDMIKDQDSKCAICQMEFDMEVQGKRPNLDHCHETNKVRGVLCFNCNTSIGKFYDDPETVYRAYLYLLSYKNKN